MIALTTNVVQFWDASMQLCFFTNLSVPDFLKALHLFDLRAASCKTSESDITKVEGFRQCFFSFLINNIYIHRSTTLTWTYSTLHYNRLIYIYGILVSERRWSAHQCLQALE